MDLTFTWKKTVYSQRHPVFAGEVVLYATVSAPGFDIHCAVMPIEFGHVGQVRAKLRLDHDTTLWSKAYDINRRGKDPAEVVSDVEAFIRAELSKCFAGEASICDIWRADLTRIAMNAGADRARQNPDETKTVPVVNIEPTSEEPRFLRFGSALALPQMSESQLAAWRKAYFGVDQ